MNSNSHDIRIQTPRAEAGISSLAGAHNYLAERSPSKLSIDGATPLLSERRVRFSADEQSLRWVSTDKLILF